MTSQTPSTCAILLVAGCLTAIPTSGARAAELQAPDPLREEISLNGIWDFYPNGGTERHDIQVPSFWDAPQDYGYPFSWLHDVRHGVYRRAFEVSAAMAEKEVFLHLERVAVIAKLFVNGKQVGGETTGGYLMAHLPYLIDITKLVRTGAGNTLELRVWAGQSIVYGSGVGLSEETNFPPDAMQDGKLLFPWCVDHYDGRRGIWGDVSLVAYPRTHVSDTFIVSDLKRNEDPADDELNVRLTLRNDADHPRTVTVRAVARSLGDGSEKPLDERVISLPAHEDRTVHWRNVSWTDARYWWPGDPQLYALETMLLEDGRPIDRHATRFGFRQFYVVGNHYALNGRRANLRGDVFEFSWHQGYRHGPLTAPVLSTKELAPATQHRLLLEYQKLNMNVLRPHKMSVTEALYDDCDEIGMMVLDEAPFWQLQQRTEDRFSHNFVEWARQWVDAHKNHPSIVVWIAANECWGSKIPAAVMDAIRKVDSSRPVFNEGVKPGDPRGDEDNRHYTDGYPFRTFNSTNLYDVYPNGTDEPRGEGESFAPDGWPLKNEDGTISSMRSINGDFNNPNLVSQSEWVRGVARYVRAMRFAELADARVYADWIYCLEPIEADLYPQWEDMIAPGIKPRALHRPVCNLVSDRYPAVIHNPGSVYWKNSYSAVAVFDVAWDAANRLGVHPRVYQPGDELDRELVIYNDAFLGSTVVDLRWEVLAVDPQASRETVLKSGSLSVDVPHGEKRTRSIHIGLPNEPVAANWLVLRLRASKDGAQAFVEDNRLGALESVPVPILTTRHPDIDLGELGINASSQWHKITLINAGGGLSEKWCASGGGDTVRLNRTWGNLRGEDEVYFRIRSLGLAPGSKHDETLTFSSKGGSTATVRVRFSIPADS